MRGKKRIKKGCKLDKTDFELSIWGKRLIRLTFGAMTPLFNYLNYLLMSIALYNLNLLKSVTTEEDYNNILKAQKDWETYKDSEFEAVSVIMEKQGTMFLNSTVGMKSALIKERALFLKEFYDTLSYKN